MASYAPVSQKIEGWISVLYIRLFRPDYSLVDIRYLALAKFSRLASYIKNSGLPAIRCFQLEVKRVSLKFPFERSTPMACVSPPQLLLTIFDSKNCTQITRNYSSVHLTIACSRHSVFGGEWKRWGSEGSTTGGLSRHSFTDRRQNFGASASASPPLFSSIESLIQSYQSDKEGMRPEVHKAPFSSV